MSNVNTSFTPPPECGPQVTGEGCHLRGTETRRWVSLLQPDGSVDLIDVRDGAAVLPANVTTCAAEEVETTQVLISNGGNVSIPNASDLTAWQVRHRTGTVTLQVNGGPIHTLDPNEVIGSNAQDGRTLTDQVVVGGTGSCRVVFTTRG